MFNVNNLPFPRIIGSIKYKVFLVNTPNLQISNKCQCHLIIDAWKIMKYAVVLYCESGSDIKLHINKEF